MASKLKTKKAKLHARLRPHRERLAWWLVLILMILLIFAWWRPIVRAFDNLTGANLFGQKTAKTIGASPVSDAQTAGQLAPAPDSSTTHSTTSDTTENTKSTTTTGTNNNGSSTNSTSTSNTGGGDTTSTGSTGGSQTPGPSLYAQVGDGQNLNTVISLAGGQPSCATSTVPLLGSQQVCTFLSNGQGVTVTLLNGKVVAKAPIGF